MKGNISKLPIPAAPAAAPAAAAASAPAATKEIGILQKLLKYLPKSTTGRLAGAGGLLGGFGYGGYKLFSDNEPDQSELIAAMLQQQAQQSKLPSWLSWLK